MHAKRRTAVTLTAALIGWLLAVTASAARAADPDEGFAFYGKLYPEWRDDRYGTGSNKGTRVGNLGTLRNDSTVLSKDVSAKAGTADHDWSNSYLGIRGRFATGPVVLGYDLQAQIDLQGNAIDNFRARDAYAYIEHPALGRIYAGQMDSIYKEYGDRVRMLGISSGNFVSTSRVLSGVSWRGQGETTFHNRRGNMVAWESPVWSRFQIGLSHSFDSGARVTGSADTLSALALRWREGPWYAAVATEIHRNWLPMSLGNDGIVPATTSVVNRPDTTRSRDQAWRLSAGWSSGDWRLATDIARLRYTEDDSAGLPGKFRFYGTTTWQFSAERRFADDWRASFNHARGAAGQCRLSGDVACSAEGLGGHLTTVGALRQINRELSLFLAAQRVHNGPGGRFASAAQGGSVRTLAAGMKYEF